MPQFQVVIVGAGIAGLATAISLQRKGHNVTVLERHASCQAVGGTVGLGANASRVLIEYGMEEIMTQKNDQSPTFYRRYNTGDIIGKREAQDSHRVYGYPHWAITRYRLQEALATVAIQNGVNILFNTLVEKVDIDNAQLHLGNGQIMKADLIIGADGVRSVVRHEVLGHDVNSKTGISGYTINIPRSTIASDPELAEFLTQQNFWLGPSQVGIGYNATDLNDTFIVCLLAEDSSGEEGEWLKRGDLNLMKDRYGYFDPRFRKLLLLVHPEDCWLWRLSSMPSLRTWSSDNGRVVSVGDAAHAILPYTGIGAGLCIEDSACLAECLERAQTIHDLPRVMKSFEKIRKPRAEYLIKMGLGLAEINHAPDGPIQQARDERFKNMPIGTTSLDIWDGKHIDDPPNVPAGHPLMYAYSVGYNVIAHRWKEKRLQLCYDEKQLR
ncbi:hypothetical protein NQ176_g2207 [Zarea fungicola]|uniref:Uncharacterized protein n=1 Tax=Zarea fungicola TaxID=93591 RepID=A0ACC1NPZ3_9HYPO|nr:hypothetical protein NQ176_g2207 [Lecanicillium fungicola]